MPKEKAELFMQWLQTHTLVFDLSLTVTPEEGIIIITTFIIIIS